MCESSDGLFTNRIKFNLTIKYEYEIGLNLIAPILHTIELYENTNYDRHTKLLNMTRVVNSDKSFV